MPKFLEKMRCSCGSAIFTRSEIIVTDPGKVSPTGIDYLKCLVCLRDLIHDRDKSLLRGVTREEGKKFLVEIERVIREKHEKAKAQAAQAAQAGTPDTPTPTIITNTTTPILSTERYSSSTDPDGRTIHD
jgi:hypothetical protein